MDDRGVPAWWSQGDEPRIWRERVEEYGAIAQDGDVLGRIFDFREIACWPEVRFVWDQWARCYIECEHGKWQADSWYLNFTEAFVRARRRWSEGADHSEHVEDEDDDA